MAKKRKRQREHDDASNSRGQTPLSKRDSPVRRDLLEHCYKHVSTLKEYVLTRLPASSRLRRKKITLLCQQETCSALETNLARLLDKTLVCTNHKQNTVQDDARWKQYLSFSQKGD